MWRRHCFVPQYPFSCFGEHFFDPIGKGIVAEVGNSEDTLGRFQDMEGKDFEFCPCAYVDGRKKGCGEDQRTDSLEPAIGQDPNILQIVALLDEADRLLYPPARHIGSHNPPQGVSAPAHGLGGQQHQRLVAKALHHD